MGSEKADVSVDCDEAEFPVERAIPVGFIVNELVTNAFKHAFVPERKGAISVALRRGKNYLLSVTDNGKGCSKSATSGLGSQLVELLVRQLEGNLERTEAMPGCRVQIEFPERA
jgi:two-component sensor histidine kinase